MFSDKHLFLTSRFLDGLFADKQLPSFFALFVAKHLVLTNKSVCQSEKHKENVFSGNKSLYCRIAASCHIRD